MTIKRLEKKLREENLECSETAPHRTQLEQLEDATLAYNAKVLELKTMTKPTLIIIYFRVSGTSQLNGESFEMQKSYAFCQRRLDSAWGCMQQPTSRTSPSPIF